MPTVPNPTVRDIKILEMIYNYDTCSVDQICKRLFGSSANPGKYGPKVNCYRRIDRLIKAGFLNSNRLASISGIGSGKRLLGLTAKGRAALAKELEISPSELRRLRQVETPIAGAHH